MSTSKDAWGIEVGSQAIKVMKLARTNTGVALEDFDVLPFKQVLTTPDLNVEEAIRVNLESLAQKHDFDKSQVVVSVPGNLAFARFAKLPPIESSKVKSMVAYEAQQQIPFPIDEVEWDYHVFEEEDSPDIEVGIFAITKEKVARFLSNYRSVGVRVDTLTLSSVAVYNAFAYGNETPDEDNTVYLDIGTSSTDIIVVDSGRIWLRTIQLGGNNFTEALMKQFKISFAKAEKLKLEAGTSKYAKQIYQAMRGVFNELVTEIQRSLGFYTSLNRDAELTKIVGVGSTWKLPGLQKYLKKNLQMEVTRPDNFSALEVEDRRAAEFSSVAVNMATAFGLALQGLGMSVVDANILPQSVLQQRMWQAKRPAFAAAAACVAVAPLIGAGVMLMTGSNYDSALGEVEGEIKATLSTAQNFKSDYDQVQTNDPRPGIRNFRRGFDYTNLYPSLMEDVVAAMSTIEPHPDAKAVNWNDEKSVAKLAEVDRSKRRMVSITEISSIYVPPTASAALPGETDDGSGEPSQPEYPSGEGGEFYQPTASVAEAGLVPPVPFPPKAPAPANSGSGYEEEGQPATPAAETEDTVSPRIAVTVRGTTTMDRSTISRVLQEKFVGWLKENQKRDDRPYVIVAELKDPRFTRAGRSADTEEINRSGQGTGSLRRTPTPKEDLPSTNRPLGGIPETLPGAGGLIPSGENESPIRQNQEAGPIEIQTPEGWYATLESGDTGFSAGTLLPRRPLSTEDSSDDVIFIFTFEVILLRPDEARPTLLDQPATDESDTPGEDTPAEASTTTVQKEQA